jgi:hypothetical protein
VPGKLVDVRHDDGRALRAPRCRRRPCRARCARTRACPGTGRARARRPSSSRSPPSSGRGASGRRARRGSPRWR